MTSVELLGHLESTHFADRARGSDLLRAVNDLTQLKEISALIDERDNDLLRLELLHLVYILLRIEDPIVGGEALRIALSYACLPRKTVKREAEKMIDVYLGTAAVNQHLKLLTLRNAWKYSSLDLRRMATRKIGIFQMTDALSLLLDNFESEDLAIKLLTITIFGKLSDKRANSEFRKILRGNEGKELTIRSLEVFSRLGNFFDRKFFYRWLEHSDKQIQLSALEGLSHLLGDKANSLLREYFTRSSQEDRSNIISFIARKPSVKRVILLLELLDSDISPDTGQKIEWTLNELDNAKKLSPIIEYYPLASEQVKFRIIVLLNEIQSTHCYAFYIEIIKKNENPFLTMSAMEAAAHYNDERTIPVLLPFLDRPDEILHYYALASYVKHSSSQLTHAIEVVVDLNLADERHHHQLLLNVLLEQSELRTLTTYLQTYVIKMMHSELSENRYLSYAVVGKYHQEFELKGIFYLFLKEKNPLVKKEAMRVFGGIFTSSPITFMKAKPSLYILSDTNFLSSLRVRGDLLVALCEEEQWSILRFIQEKYPRDFLRTFLEIISILPVKNQVIAEINLSQISHSDFMILWDHYETDDSVRSHLIAEASRRAEPQFGSFLMSEFLVRGKASISPYLSRYINGLP